MGSQAATAPPVAFQINANDNVATLLEPAQPGPVIIHGPATERQIVALDSIEQSHKIAVRSIAKGEDVVKYGVVIGAATCAIQQGDWVHLHNCGSRLDERSNAFDVHTGVPEDVRYE